MEGGTDHDLKVLELPEEEERGPEPPKREEPRGAAGDSKPPEEKEDKEKVCMRGPRKATVSGQGGRGVEQGCDSWRVCFGAKEKRVVFQKWCVSGRVF